MSADCSTYSHFHSLLHRVCKHLLTFTFWLSPLPSFNHLLAHRLNSGTHSRSRSHLSIYCALSVFNHCSLISTYYNIPVRSSHLVLSLISMQFFSLLCTSAYVSVHVLYSPISCIRSFRSRSRARRSSSLSLCVHSLNKLLSHLLTQLCSHTQLGTGSLPALVCLPISGMHSLNELLSRLLTHQLYSLTQLANCSIPVHLLAHPLYCLQSSRRTHRVCSSTRLLSEFRRWFTRFLVSPSSIRC